MKSPTTLTLAILAASQLVPLPSARAAPTPSPARVVVLDPGHGGSNAGAKGAVTGAYEKALTLELAKRVASRLHHRRIDARLTRTDDRTLTLRQRVDHANELAAELFVSIHANASADRVQRGFETFVLTAQGIDVDGRALRSCRATPRDVRRSTKAASGVSTIASAETTPACSSVVPRALSRTASATTAIDDETALILDDVERGASQWEAAELAVRVQRSLRATRGKAGDRGVRQDAHHVLLGATMPAVLVEVGFIDHPIEGKQLLDTAVQDELAAAIADAIEEQLAMTD